MNTEYEIRMTVAVPEDFIDEANEMALCLGEDISDRTTFGPPQYVDAQGNKYSVCSTLAKLVVLMTFSDTLSYPDFTMDVDLQKANTARSIAVIEYVQASPTTIVCIIEQSPTTALDILNLELINE